MYFQHSSRLRSEHPGLVAGVLSATGIDASPVPDLSPYFATAKDRLGSSSESDLPEIQAWRRTFASMGLKPTQYRCASEALLRRFRKEGTLPRSTRWSTSATRSPSRSPSRSPPWTCPRSQGIWRCVTPPATRAI
ncbi:hypothetical protein [Actinomadura sp. 6N118]|uniref:hypothetical protein n=1 Tax=Actinomadura sp. 6N118 TaxID=3375151 RepID=UPI0037A32FD2